MKKLKLYHTDEDWKIEAILGEDILRQELPLMKALVAKIKEKKTISPLVQTLAKHLPLNSQHLFLKRVNAGASVIICIEDTASSEDELRQNLGEAVWNQLIQVGLVVPLLQSEIPAIAPQTRAQFENAKTYWPCHFHEDKRLEAILGK